MQHHLNVGDICVDRSKYDRAKLSVQRVQIRKFNDAGTKAIVHFVHCPSGMVFAIDVTLLNIVDTEGFLRPSPCNRTRGLAADAGGGKRTRL